MIILKHPSVINEEESLFGPNSAVDKSEDPVVLTQDGKVIDLKFIKELVNEGMKALSSSSPILKEVYLHKNVIYTDDSKNCPTMCTDGFSIFVNPGFVYQLYEDLGDEGAVEGIAFVLAHEAMHIRLEHVNQMKRYESEGESRDWSKANIAMDMEVNFILETFMRDEANGGSLFESGVTKRCHGMWCDDFDEKYRTWEKCYDDVEVPQFPPIMPKKMSDEWNRGFIEGYRKYLEKLRHENLVEHLIISK